MIGQSFCLISLHTIPHLTTYYHFHCKASHSGVVFVREFADSEEKEVSLTKRNIIVDMILGLCMAVRHVNEA